MKKELKSGSSIVFISKNEHDEIINEMELNYIKGYGGIYKYYITFNLKTVYSYKTYTFFLKKVNELINKHNLKRFLLINSKGKPIKKRL